MLHQVWDPFKNGSHLTNDTWLLCSGIFQIVPEPQKSLTFHHGSSEHLGETPATPISSWWLNQPIWKIWSSNWESSSPNRDEPRFPWNKGISLSQLPFGVRSCEVAIIWPGILNMCYKNAILTLTNWNHPWLGFMAKLHTQRGLRGFLLDEPPADWSNDKWKDHEASNGKNMSCNCFPGVLLLRHSSIGRRPWRLQIFGKTSLGCLYHVYLQGAPIELSPHHKSSSQTPTFPNRLWSSPTLTRWTVCSHIPHWASKSFKASS